MYNLPQFLDKQKGSFLLNYEDKFIGRNIFRNIISIPTKIKWECTLLSSDFDNVIYYLTVEEKEAYGAQTPFQVHGCEFKKLFVKNISVLYLNACKTAATTAQCDILGGIW